VSYCELWSYILLFDQHPAPAFENVSLSPHPTAVEQPMGMIRGGGSSP